MGSAEAVMASTLDLRTYLLLERAFVRRLQRSWRIMSAPIYAKITQACLDHKWDEARRLVPELDMAEVGTENREWIRYMLLSCAVFGAGTVAKGKPSFVGAGTFDTFLRQVTNNLLQYLEFSGTAQVQAEALQAIAEDEAKTKALKYDPAQPRDKQGQWTRTGAVEFTPGDSPIEGGGPARAHWAKRNQEAMDAFDAYIAAKVAHKVNEDRATAAVQARIAAGEKVENDAWERGDSAYRKTKRALTVAKEFLDIADAAVKAAEPGMKKEVIKNVADSVALQMGVDPDIIDVVHQEPRVFEVGGRQFREAGHFNPVTGRIQLNAFNIDYGNAAAVRGITAHEVSHHIYYALADAAEAERDRYKKLSNYYYSDSYEDRSAWFKERFTQDTLYGPIKVKPEYAEEIAREFPAETILSKLAGNNEMFSGISDRVKEEDGHSEYSQSYWSESAVRLEGTYDKAINETVAETTRFMVSPNSWHETKTPQPDNVWVQFTKAMHEWYTEGNELRKAGAARIRAKHARRTT